ncbi:MAG: hypothetical protein BWK80_16080 [Desulfobacteraceae bacterium IS3]|nr:MAG: hypothetical protein BWK80_16080 [Desulfobacteraceae bacterium IS3]
MSAVSLFFNRKVSQSKSQSSAKIYFKTLRNFAGTLRNFAVHFSARMADKAQRVRLFFLTQRVHLFFLTILNSQFSIKKACDFHTVLSELSEKVRSHGNYFFGGTGHVR